MYAQKLSRGRKGLKTNSPGFLDEVAVGEGEQKKLKWGNGLQFWWEWTIMSASRARLRNVL